MKSDSCVQKLSQFPQIHQICVHACVYMRLRLYAQIGVQLSRALEAKMGELMGEIELRLRPPAPDDGADRRSQKSAL